MSHQRVRAMLLNRIKGSPELGTFSCFGMRSGRIKEKARNQEHRPEGKTWEKRTAAKWNDAELTVI